MDHVLAGGTTYKKSFVVTDSLHNLFPNGKGYALDKWENGENAFYVTATNPGDKMCGIWFPYNLFKGRRFKVSYRFYIIIKDQEYCKVYSTNTEKD